MHLLIENYLLLLQVVEKNKDTESVWRCDALREILKEVHSLFMMFHGSLRSLLDKQPSGELVRSHLYSFVLDYLTGKTTIYQGVISHAS